MSVDETNSQTTLDLEDRARLLIPYLRQNQMRINAARSVPEEVFARLKEAETGAQETCRRIMRGEFLTVGLRVRNLRSPGIELGLTALSLLQCRSSQRGEASQGVPELTRVEHRQP